MQHKVDSKIGLSFLKTQIEVGLAFAGIALDALPHQSEKITRNRRRVEQAYRAIVRYRPLVDVDAETDEQLSLEIGRLESVLRQLESLGGACRGEL